MTVNVTDPDLARLYGVTLWVSLALAVMIALGRSGLRSYVRTAAASGAHRRLVQYGAVVVCWVTVVAR